MDDPYGSSIRQRSKKAADLNRLVILRSGIKYLVATNNRSALSRYINATTTQSYSVLQGRADAGVIVLCDHASNTLPDTYGTLGLQEKDLKRHIAYDIGAAALTEALSKGLEAPALMTRYSRLFIDPNRGEDDPTLIMRLSDGAIVPGNRHVDEAERQLRITQYYRPYHDAIDATIDQCLASGIAPILLSIHSFTESWKDVPRPWHASVLWGQDSRLAHPLLNELRREEDLIIGANEPYCGDLVGDTMWQHGTMRGLAHAIVEVRQDLIQDRAGQDAWSERLLRIMKALLASPVNRAAFQSVMTCQVQTSRNNSSQERDIQMSERANKQTKLEAAVFRRLVQHLRERNDVQNIDLMNLAGFCRNCLSNWYAEAAGIEGIALTQDEAREIVYGMPYAKWKEKYQREATEEQKARFQAASGEDH